MVGKCIVDSFGNIVELKREFFRQGWIFKDEEAYKNNYDLPCYVPELYDVVYTAADFLDECGGIKEVADELFDSVDWQNPTTLLEEWLVAREVEFCVNCKKMYWSFGREECACCNKRRRSFNMKEGKMTHDIGYITSNNH